MKIKFLGAARTVTGSCYILETNNHRFAVDCGMYQGNKEIEKRNWNNLNLYQPQKLDFILITHAHIDHSGLLPRMVKKGFNGAIYCTPPTKDLLSIMLKDSAHIQEMEAKWSNTKRMRLGNKPQEPLYTQSDADKVNDFIVPVDYGNITDIFPEIKIKFNDAGHILGSSFIEIWIEEGEDKTKLVFSGDLGRPNRFIIRDPEIIEHADYLFLESTYGARNHKNEEDSLEELHQAIKCSYEKKGKVIIPAFAVERSQEIIYALRQLWEDGKLPADMPIFLDSPLAIRTTEIFRKYKQYYDQKSTAIVHRGQDPLDLPNLEFTLTREESAKLNTLEGKPAIIISASGMANAGRIKHHLRHNLWREEASIVFVGFQAQGTPGRRIVDGAKTIKILGEETAVNASIYTIGGFSAHAGQSQILDWLSNFKQSNMQIFLVHGEYTGQKTLAAMIKDKYDLQVHIPDYLEESELKPGEIIESIIPQKEKAIMHINWDFLMEETENKISQLKQRKEMIQKMEWANQTDIQEHLLEIHSAITKLISEIYEIK